jgi:hypothetical protein
VHNDKLKEYQVNYVNEIEGWIDLNLFTSIEPVNTIQVENEICGNICEIGVHHGRFFLLLHALKRAQEKSIAIDIFEDQFLNIDSSGQGSKERLMESIELFGYDVESIKVLVGDSLVLSSDDILRFSDHTRLWLMSIDGGHTVGHTMNDLALASKLIANGGVVFFDDFNNILWPEVREGFYKYMDRMKVVLAPFAYHANKLLLTTLSYHDIYLKAYQEQMQQRAGELKETRMSGHKVITLR